MPWKCDGSHLDSLLGGLSSDEEQEIDNMLKDNCERRAEFSLVSAFVSEEVMCGLPDFCYSKSSMLMRLFNRIF